MDLLGQAGWKYRGRDSGEASKNNSHLEQIEATHLKEGHSKSIYYEKL
jgi:hypothetical protein